jgi:hypothetical protein
MNGGFFVFRHAVLDHIGEGEELVEQPFERLIAKSELLAYRYTGFFAPMDTLKDKHNLEALAERGRPSLGGVGAHAGRGSAVVLALTPQALGHRLSVLVLGCHPDDIEIGCHGALGRLVATAGDLDVTWVVLSGRPDRAVEARRSAMPHSRAARASGWWSTTFGTASSRTRAQR